MRKLELETIAIREDCDIPIYKDLPVPMVMLQGWFNDQHSCFRLFVCKLNNDQRLHLFTDESVRESVKEIYKDMWAEFKNAENDIQGVHKRIDHLRYAGGTGRGFAYWIACVFGQVEKAGGLENLLDDLGTVEKAHSIFKQWFYRSKYLVRGLNAADAARILARYEYLEPEKRPLLARGALRGAAILLDGQPSNEDIDWFEDQYADEASRVELEEKAAKYVASTDKFEGAFQMEMGESWFCRIQK